MAATARSLVLALGLLAPSAASAQPAPFLIVDSDFLDSDWTVTVGVTNSPGHTEEYRPSGGNPGSYRHMSHVLPGPSYISVRHLKEGSSAIYDPAMQGAIAGITYSEDQIQIAPPFSGAGVGALFFVQQDGRVHFSTDISYTQTDWTHRKLTCLKPESFTMSGGQLPDFSDTGKPLRFGFLRGNTSNSQSGSITVTHGIDNFRVVVFPEPNPECVGEPADLTVEKVDDNHKWGQAPTIPYRIDVKNTGGTATDAVVTETVPEKTSFDAGSSSPGWQCAPDASAGSTCTKGIVGLGPNTTESVAFHVEVDDGTDPRWDVYNEVSAAAVGGGAPLPIATSVARGVAPPFGPITGAVTENGVCALDGSLADEVNCCIWCFMEPIACACLYSDDCPLALPPLSPGALRGVDTETPGADPRVLYRLRDFAFAKTRGGRRATDLYYQHGQAMAAAASEHPDLVVSGLTNLATWQRNMRALVAGEGETETVTQAQVDGLDGFLDALRDVADGDLAAAIDRERARLDIELWAGITSDELLARLDRLSCEGYEETLFCGELTGDCKVSAPDALFALQMGVGSRDDDLAGDIDASGSVTAGDALKILRIAVAIDPLTDSCND